MGSLLDRTMIVEIRTGGDGLIGIKAVKAASPDGTTILVTTGPTMYLLPMVETTPSFDAAKDFVPVGQLARFEFCVFVGTAVPAEVKDFKQFVAWLKANPDQATFGVPSNGTIPHFSGSRLEQALGIKLTRVAYRGSAPIINDLVGGHMPVAISTLTDAIPQHPARNVRILASGSETRSPFLPDAPTLKESGVDLVADAWYGMWLPAGASSDFAKKLSEAAATPPARPPTKEKHLPVRLFPGGSPPQSPPPELPRKHGVL